VLFVCYPKCATCRKAGAWLEEKKIPYDFRDIKTDRPTMEELKRWQKESGLPLKRFFNTSGQSYRALKLSEALPDMPEEEQLRLLASDGMLVRRPILVGSGFVLVGFNEKEWGNGCKRTGENGQYRPDACRTIEPGLHKHP